MRRTDVAVIGGGLAGSTAAAMLGRAGIDAILVDPHKTYPPDFRAEKLDATQVAIFGKTGIADAVLARSAHTAALWIAQRGRVIDRKPDGDQYGIVYDDLVNAIRAEIPERVPFIEAKVSGISTGAERQTVKLSTGAEISARLVVMASGLNLSLRHMLGLERIVTDTCHSITLGFDLKPVGRAAFDFPALTWYAARSTDRFAYLTLFPTQSAMRANLLVYRELADPWLTRFRNAPEAALRDCLPGLAKVAGEFAIAGPLKIRPADLYVTRGHVQAGVVLVGDAFATSCPAAGTGTGKVFNDVERLCNIHIPAWLASDGMDENKIAAFYADPVKQAYDTFSINRARWLRAISTEPGLKWAALRFVRFAKRAAAGLTRSPPLAPDAPGPVILDEIGKTV